eukprot:scaffold106646_cov31-Tisochrysis_lutea.AAC.7
MTPLHGLCAPVQRAREAQGQMLRLALVALWSRSGCPPPGRSRHHRRTPPGCTNELGSSGATRPLFPCFLSSAEPDCAGLHAIV